MMKTAYRSIIVGSSVLYTSLYQIDAFTGIQVLHRTSSTFVFPQTSGYSRNARSRRIAPNELSSFPRHHHDRLASLSFKNHVFILI